ncbi:MAG: hypothetical protein NZ602_08220 [Thermoguttaceae bacterium]|nr:hypothetical protein [Thermoguttaceae bacterium]MDW8037266.1 flagellar hook capping FlgD N-terminal domain-containing protein [Thermoguttaceae bacterium]
MSTVYPNTGLVTKGAASEKNTETTKVLFKEMSPETFLKLLITELRHQDPLNPMQNSEMVQQLNQIYQLQANMKLVEAFEALGMTQNVASAMSLLGKRVQGLSESGENVSGQVERVSFADGAVQLHVGSQVIRLENVTEVAMPND